MRRFDSYRGYSAEAGRVEQNTPVPPPPPRTRWTSFVADPGAPGQVVRGLHEQANPRHRLRVEHNANTLLIHLTDEQGETWTTIAVDRATRSVAHAHGRRQEDSAQAAYNALYRER